MVELPGRVAVSSSSSCGILGGVRGSAIEGRRARPVTNHDGPALRVLGPITILRGATPGRVGGAVPRRLLALLVLNRGFVVHVDRVVQVLWGEQPPERAVASLRSHISRLRRVLPQGSAIEAVPPGYRLTARSGDVDAERFLRSLDVAIELLPRQPHEALDEVEAGLELWSGTALGEFAEDWWARAEAVRLEEQRVFARELRLEAMLALGHVQQAVGDSRQLTAEFPGRERPRLLLVRSLQASGRSRDALLAAHEYREQLLAASGLTPSASFSLLEGEVLAGSPSLNGAPLAAPPVGPGPPAPSLDLLRLPPALTSFHGRQEELAEVAATVSTSRCTTLLGPGGMGKTRLALEVATVVAPHFVDGVWFCSLAELVEGDAGAVPHAVADCLGVRADRGVAMVDALAGWIGPRQALLIFDNCEHVGPGAVELATGLLRRCPSMRVLATSREPLHMPGEVRRHVGPLDAAAARSLFVQRLRQYRAGVSDQLVDDDDVVALCDQLGNIPLAIELAAARCRAASPAEIIARLNARPGALGDHAARPAPPTLTEVLDWSIDHVDPLARQVLPRLSVFHGGFNLEQAEQVVGGAGIPETEVLDGLASLVDAGLVSVRRDGSSSRYAQLEPIRQHAARLLGPAEQEELADRHGRAFAQFARAVGEGLRGPSFVAWARAAEGDLANFRAAHTWAIARRRPEVSVAIVAGLREYFNDRLVTELSEWADESVALTRGRSDALEAAALAAATTSWMHQRRYDDVFAAFERTRRDLRADADTLAEVAWAAGWCKVNSGTRRDAAPIWAEALDARPSAWPEALLRASLGTFGRAEDEGVDELIETLSSPTLRIWRHIWAAKVVGLPTTLAETDASLADVLDRARSIGATHALVVALYLRAFVQAQLPDCPTGLIVGQLDEAIALWSTLRLPSQLLVTTLEASAFTLALRGDPASATTLLAFVDRRGGTLWSMRRGLLRKGLDALPGQERQAALEAARRFGALEDAARFAAAAIAALANADIASVDERQALVAGDQAGT